jgi:hypothetical protein
VLRDPRRRAVYDRRAQRGAAAWPHGAGTPVLRARRGGPAARRSRGGGTQPPDRAHLRAGQRPLPREARRASRPSRPREPRPGLTGPAGGWHPAAEPHPEREGLDPCRKSPRPRGRSRSSRS